MVSKMKWVWTTLKIFKKFYVMKSIGKNVQFFVHTFKEHFVHGNAQISRDTVLRNVINSNNCQFKESHKINQFMVLKLFQLLRPPLNWNKCGL